MNTSLSAYNIELIDFQDIHKQYEIDLLNDIHEFGLFDKLKADGISSKDIKKLVYHHTIKSVVEYFNKCESDNKLVLYFNNTQFYESELVNYIDEQAYLKFISSFLVRVRNMLPIKVVISQKSLIFFNELFNKNDGRAVGTVIKIRSAISKFKIEDFTFSKVKKFALKYELNFLSRDYFNNFKTKQLLFK